MLGFVFVFHVEAAYFTPNVPASDAVVQHVGRAVYRDADFFQVGVGSHFSESVAPAVYGSTNSRRMAFMDRLWALTLTFILMSVPLSQLTWS